MAQQKDIDLTIYGATGYTGKLVAEYFSQKYAAQGMRWAIAGRNQEKLSDVYSDLQGVQAPEIIVADASDKAALEVIAQRSKVVIAVAGPYIHYGTHLVQACTKYGTDYVDLCGEANWIRQMVDENTALARETGARLVHSCGFDSIPSDLGVLLVQQHAIKETGEPFNHVKGRVEAIAGTASGGTVASIGASMAAAAGDRAIAELLASPYALTPDFVGPEQPDGNTPKFDEELNTWCTPFIMAEINTKTVHRSNQLLGHLYGETFLYEEMMSTGPGADGEAIARALADEDFSESEEAKRAPGEGPTKEEREAGHFTLAFYGSGGDISAVARVSGFQDPGYGSTSKMLVESAMCLLNDAVPTRGGVWTAASAMGEQLHKRMVEQGVLESSVQTL